MLGATGQQQWIPVWICAGVGVHFFPLASTLANRSLRLLGVLLMAVAAAALATGLASGTAPSTVTGAGAGSCLLAFGLATLLTGGRAIRSGVLNRPGRRTESIAAQPARCGTCRSSQPHSGITHRGGITMAGDRDRNEVTGSGPERRQADHGNAPAAEEEYWTAERRAAARPVPAPVPSQEELAEQAERAAAAPPEAGPSGHLPPGREANGSGHASAAPAEGAQPAHRVAAHDPRRAAATSTAQSPRRRMPQHRRGAEGDCARRSRVLADPARAGTRRERRGFAAPSLRAP